MKTKLKVFTAEINKQKTQAKIFEQRLKSKPHLFANMNIEDFENENMFLNAVQFLINSLNNNLN